MHGPTFIFWAHLTPFSLARRRKAEQAQQTRRDVALKSGAAQIRDTLRGGGGGGGGGGGV
jgi:hypothetical protein